MIRRIIVTAALLATPITVLADDANTLGPSTNSTIGGTSDTGTSSLLQPAGTSSLQSSGEQGSGITQAPTNSNLQPAGSADANKDLLVAEGSGDQHQLAEATPSLSWPLIGGLASLFVLVLVTLMYLENRRLRLLAAPSDTPEPEVRPAPAKEPEKPTATTQTSDETAPAETPEDTAEPAKPDPTNGSDSASADTTSKPAANNPD